VVARQSIPRFDLYAELGVEPSADDGAIESAYHWQIDQHLPNVDAAATRSRVARLNTARDWLSDSELRSRYDASQARAARAAARTTAAGRTTRKPAARRAKATAAETSAAGAVVGATSVGATALTAAEAAEAEVRAAAEADAALASRPIRPEPARADFSWPAADLNRPATPDVPRPRRSRRMLRGIAGLAALVAVAALVVLAIALRPASTPIAVASPTAPPPTPTAVPETQNPTPEPTVAITAPPATPAGPDIATLQQAAWNTIQALAAAAAAGDVETAQTMLGDTAPDLRVSGLKRAVFPDVEAAGISIDPSGAPYTAIAADDRLTSPDGVTWTFDYGDRPLAAYRMPAKVDPYDLYWIESDGKHHLFLRVATATVSKSGVTVDFAWHYAADRPDDATYFRRASILISSVTLDDTPIPVTATSVSMRGVTTLTATAAFNGVPTVPDLLTIGVTVSNPRTAGGAARAIEVSFKLEGR
jgi:hypothetical protein